MVNRLPDNRYVVIEGNTRLQIYKEFKKEKDGEKKEQNRTEGVKLETESKPKNDQKEGGCC